MNRTNYIAFLFIILNFAAYCQSNEKSTMKNQKYNQLTKEEERVIVNKGTEYPFSGKYNNHYLKGTYVCKRC